MIYHVERIEPYYSAALPLWQGLDARAVQVVTSQIALLEVLVKPLRDNRADLAGLYRSVFLGTIGLSCLNIDLSITERAAKLRAVHGLRTPDAIHAATAMAVGCSLLVTNDPVFRRVPGLNVAVLSEVIANP